MICFLENRYSADWTRITSYNVCYTKLLRVVILLAWGAAGPAVASGPDTVDFPGAVGRALKNNATVSAAGYERISAHKAAEAARGNYRITSYNVCYTKLLRKRERGRGC